MKIFNTLEIFPELIKENQIFIMRFNIYSGTLIQTKNISILVDPSKIPDFILTKIKPDYIILSHLSLDHFDKESILKFIGPKTKVLASIQCFIQLYNFFKIKKLDSNIYLTMRDFIFEDENLFINFYESIHGDYLEPVTFKIVLRELKYSLYHGIDSLPSKTLEEGLIGKVDIAIIPMGIAPNIDLNLFSTIASQINSKYIIPNHVLPSRLNEFRTNLKNFEKLDWSEGLILNLEPRTVFDLEIYRSQKENAVFETKLSQIHLLDMYELYINQTLSLNQDPIELYKAIVATSVIALENPNLYKKVIYEQLLELLHYYINEKYDYRVGKEKNLKKLMIGASIWSLGHFYSITSENFAETEIFNNIVKLGDQYLIYWLCESLSRIGISNQNNYSKVLNIFINIMNSPLWEEVLNRRVFAWSLYYLLEDISDKVIWNVDFFIENFFNFLNDENPEVKLIGILSLELITNKIDSQEMILSIIKSLKNMLSEDEFELIEATLECYLTVLKKYPHLKKLISELIEEDYESLIDYPNWHVRNQFQKLSLLLI